MSSLAGLCTLNPALGLTVPLSLGRAQEMVSSPSNLGRSQTHRVSSAAIPVPSHSCPGHYHWLRSNSPPAHSGRQKRKLYSFFDRVVCLTRRKATSPSIDFNCLEVLRGRSGERISMMMVLTWGNYLGLPGVLLQVEDRVVQIEGCW